MTHDAVRIFAVEDDFFHQENLRITLDELGYDLVGLENNAETALERFKETRPDVVLLDIQLAGAQSGIDLGHSIHQFLPTPIIYITSFADPNTYRKASFTHPYAYLTKPVEKLALQSSIELAMQHLSQPDANTETWESDVFFRSNFFIKVGPRLIKIRPEEVLYIQVSGNRYCEVVTADRKANVRATLTEIQQNLAPSPFIRVHRSYLVNPLHIDSIHEVNQTIVIAGQEIPLGKTYREGFMRKLRQL